MSLVRKPGWTTPALLVLGLLSSLAETLGITLILLFFYTALGQQDPSLMGLTGRILMRVAHVFGNPAILAGAILTMILLRAAITYVYTLTSSHVGEAISQQARNRIHQQYLSVEYGFLQARETAELMETLGTESWLVARAYGSWTRLMVNACSVVVFTAFLLILSWKITLVAVVGSLAMSWIARRFRTRARDLGAQVREIHRDLSDHMLMSLQSMRTIRAYGQEKAHQLRFERSSERARAASIQVERMSAWLSPITEVGYLGILCVIVAGVEWWGIGFAGTLGAVVLLYRLQPHVRELEGNLLYLAQIQPQLRSVRSMMETADKVYPVDGARELAGIRRDIRFEHLSFRYPSGEKDALDDVSFTIPAGATTALIGASGAGKTTVVNLLLRLYAPGSGHILVDGMPLDELRRDQWLGMIGIAGQDVDLVEGTVIDNIRMADDTASEERVVAAARSAGVSDFVEGTIWGYETWIGQEGMRFSGGQRQRIGLARALLRDPGFMILDEAMSALDQALEERIRHEIAGKMAGQTCLLITHRIEMIRHADHIVWIENGRVRAEGSPADLFDSALADLGRSVPE
jgi:ATP-binding cassette, subfamily B, bacterial MsbA